MLACLLERSSFKKCILNSFSRDLENAGAQNAAIACMLAVLLASSGRLLSGMRLARAAALVQGGAEWEGVVRVVAHLLALQ